MGQFTRSSVDYVLPLVVSHLASDPVSTLSPSTCYLADEEELQAVVGNEFALVIAGDCVPRINSQGGSQRDVCLIDQEIIITAWVRFGVDRAGASAHILTDPQGILPLSFAIINSLEGMFIQDTAGLTYCFEGIWWKRSKRPKRKKGSEEWITQENVFALPMQLNLGVRSPLV